MATIDLSSSLTKKYTRPLCGPWIDFCEINIDSNGMTVSREFDWFNVHQVWAIVIVAINNLICFGEWVELLNILGKHRLLTKLKNTDINQSIKQVRKIVQSTHFLCQKEII